MSLSSEIIDEGEMLRLISRQIRQHQKMIKELKEDEKELINKNNRIENG